MTTEILLQAEAQVEAFCQNLDHLLQQAHERQKSLQAEARQLRRLLDEMEVRLRLAHEKDAVSPTWTEQLSGQYDEARRQEQALLADCAEAEESCRRLELLRRQVEMSGRSLRQEVHLRADDPWELALRSQILYGREQERLALAREVHDGPAQVLSNSVLGLERCRQADDPDEKMALMEDLLRDVRWGLQEVRRFIYELRPSPLADEPLSQQIERYIQDLESAYQIAVDFRWAPCPHDLSAEETIAIYRIVQEALLNIRKHARAEKCSVEAYVEPAAWVIRVADSGAGFDPALALYAEDHWGLRGMRERAHLIGAELQIESRPHEGTVILLRLPLHPPDSLEGGAYDGKGQ